MHKVELSARAAKKLIRHMRFRMVSMHKVHRRTRFWRVGGPIHSRLSISTARIANTVTPSIHLRFIDEYWDLNIWLACFCAMFYGCIRPWPETVHVVEPSSVVVCEWRLYHNKVFVSTGRGVGRVVCPHWRGRPRRLYSYTIYQRSISETTRGLTARVRLGEEGEVPSSEKILTRESPLASAIASLYDATVQVGEHASRRSRGDIRRVPIGLANALVIDQLQGHEVQCRRAQFDRILGWRVQI